MKAILCKEYGPADKLVIEDVPSPEVKGRGVKVRVKAAGLNFPDTLIIEGKYQNKNVYIQNGFGTNGVGFCAKEVKVNGQITTDEVLVVCQDWSVG